MTEADKELSELLDSALEYFRGDKSVQLDNFRELYKDEMHKFYPIENAFKILQGDGLINCLSTGYVLSPKGFGVVAHINQLGYVANYNKRQKSSAPTSVIEISDAQGPVFVHSPVSDANIETKIAPTVTPKKNMSINKIIATFAALITIILGIIFFYDRCN